MHERLREIATRQLGEIYVDDHATPRPLPAAVWGGSSTRARRPALIKDLQRAPRWSVRSPRRPWRESDTLTSAL
jgi:hypothetical protein